MVGVRFFGEWDRGGGRGRKIDVIVEYRRGLGIVDGVVDGAMIGVCENDEGFVGL